MSTIYLHIGLPKTGTTTIQHLMWDNRSFMEKHDLCFPDFDYRYSNVGLRRNGHFLVEPFTAQKAERSEALQKFEAAMAKVEELGEHYSRILLSDEALWEDGYSGPELWSGVKEAFEKRNLAVKIIVYLRRQDLWVQSFWAHRVRRGSILIDGVVEGCCLSLQEYIQYLRKIGYPMDYYSYIQRLAGLFGKENIIVRILEKGQYRGEEHTLCSDFLDIFHIPWTDELSLGQEVYNPEFSGIFLEIKRRLNHLQEFQNYPNPLTEKMQKLQRTDHYGIEDNRFSFFKKGEQKKFYESFSEANGRLAREYLGRDDGILFYEQVEELPEFQISDKELLDHTIILYGYILNDLLETMEEQQKLIDAYAANSYSISKLYAKILSKIKK